MEENLVTRLEFSLCDFQEEGLIAGMMEWAAKEKETFSKLTEKRRSVL